MDEQKRTPGRPQIYQGWHEERRETNRRAYVPGRSDSTVIQPEQVIKRTRLERENGPEAGSGTGRTIAEGARLSEKNISDGSRTAFTPRRTRPERIRSEDAEEMRVQAGTGTTREQGRRREDMAAAQEASSPRVRRERMSAGQSVPEQSTGRAGVAAKQAPSEQNTGRARAAGKQGIPEQSTGRAGVAAKQAPWEQSTGRMRASADRTPSEHSGSPGQKVAKRRRQQQNEAKLRGLWIVFGVLVAALIGAIVYEIVLGNGTKETGAQRMEQQRQEKLMNSSGAGNQPDAAPDKNTDQTDSGTETENPGAEGGKTVDEKPDEENNTAEDGNSGEGNSTAADENSDAGNSTAADENSDAGSSTAAE